MTHSCKVQKSIPGNILLNFTWVIVWVHTPPKKNSEPLYPQLAQKVLPLHRIPCAKFRKNESNERVKHSHLLEQLRLRPLDVGSVGSDVGSVVACVCI